MCTEPEELGELSPFSMLENFRSASQKFESSLPTQVDDDMFASANRCSTRSRSSSCVAIALAHIRGESARERREEKDRNSNAEQQKGAPAYSMNVEIGSLKASRPRGEEGNFLDFGRNPGCDGIAAGVQLKGKSATTSRASRQRCS